ncbi:Zinc finger CCHC domain-containing protein 4 [Triplophysa tibetana]|uniref:Zinc finger CCHC domain-containing protein 4 n=1 Tax=Triplophysa tibetana TaxID=1572043 RepID=A0A5A9PX42_9TELE|nr:Zinc finger CCHC domain-containing protein 4 [Triplophysa tibetana]
MIWIFPYFFESRILECFPSFSMLDYQVDYDNHALYKHGKTGRKQSPVRLFTNLSPKDIILPADEGYRFCSICERYVSAGNKHCPRCNTCPSKHGDIVPHVVTVLCLITRVDRAKPAVSSAAVRNTNSEPVLRNTTNGK